MEAKRVYEEQMILEAEHGNEGNSYVTNIRTSWQGGSERLSRISSRPTLPLAATKGGCSLPRTYMVERSGKLAVLVRTIFGAKSNISLSLDQDELKCMVCSDGHTVLERRGRAARSTGVRLVFLLGDQALPANLPRGQDSGCCVGVIRREYAALDSLIDTFMGMVKYHLLPAGSVIVISSASQIASEGTSDYARALVDAENQFELKGQRHKIFDYANTVCASRTTPTWCQLSQRLRGTHNFRKYQIRFFVIFCYLFKVKKNVVDYADTVSTKSLTMLARCQCSR